MVDLNIPMEEIVKYLTPAGQLEFELASTRAMFARSMARVEQLEAELEELRTQQADQAHRS